MGEQALTYDQVEARMQYDIRVKIQMSLKRIREWYDRFNGDVYISFSGGKDSTVLLDLVRRVCPNVKAVFCNTGLEWPQVVDFVDTIPNVEIIRPKHSFKAVIEKWGYPVVSKEQAQYIYEARTSQSPQLRAKRMGECGNSFCISKKWRHLVDAPFAISHKCCDALKKQPFKAYEKRTGLKPYLGWMVTDSRLRRQQYARHGCNEVTPNRAVSRPIIFWREEDIWEYIQMMDLKISPIYDMGYERTGCMFCMFGLHMEDAPNRFQRMAQTHPKQHSYCMGHLGLGDVLDFMEIPHD